MLCYCSNGERFGLFRQDALVPNKRRKKVKGQLGWLTGNRFTWNMTVKTEG